MTHLDDPFPGRERRVLEAGRERRVELFRQFVHIPSVSMLPEHEPDCRRAAHWLADRLVAAGLEHVEVCETGGLPVVYADWLHAPGAPTLLVYGHYDVQPVEPRSAWTYDPFEATVADGRILGRGTADDKGQILVHVDAAEVLLQGRGELPVNVRYLFEGEEESDGDHLEGWLDANADRLRADLAVVSDTGFFEGDLPAVTVGLRGIVGVQVDVHGAPVELHSGSHGGVARNPAMALASILAALTDDQGRVDVPGFYDDVVELTSAQRAALDELPFDEAAYLKAIGVAESVGESGRTLLERRGTRPTVDVNGMWSGFTGAGLMTIVPTSAHAKVSCRLVPDQDPDRVAELLTERILAAAPSGVTVQVHDLGRGRPLGTSVDAWYVEAAARSLEQCFGRRPVLVWEGGSIPACEAIHRVLDVPTLLLGFTPPNCNTHAPDEWMSLAHYERGVLTVVDFMDRMAAHGDA